MDFLQHTAQLISELDKTVSLINATTQDEPGFWNAYCEEDLTVHFELDEQHSKLTMFAEVGRPAPEHAAQKYQDLLIYNALWQDTGGFCGGCRCRKPPPPNTRRKSAA